jgi:hypothetical protein
MARTQIHIETLRIRLPRAIRHQASAVGRSIAQDVATHIATAAGGRTGAIRIDEISLGRVKSVDRAGEIAAGKVRGMLNDRNRK